MTVEKTKEIMMGYFSGHNPEALAEDAIFTMMSDGTEDKGRKAIAQRLQSFYRAPFEGKFESTNTVFGDGHVFTEGYLVGKHIGEFAGIPATNRDVRVPMCISYGIGDEKIEKARVYVLMVALTQQLGIS